MTITSDIDVDFDRIYEFLESADRAEGIVTYTAPYALYVEVDTSYDRGLRPPFQPLFDWTLRNITSDRDEAEDIAYAIQEKIYQTGIDGEYYLLTTKKEWQSKWKEVAENYNNGSVDAPEQIVEDILEGMLEDSISKLKNSGKEDTGNLIDSGLVLMGANTDRTEDVEIDVSGLL